MDRGENLIGLTQIVILSLTLTLPTCPVCMQVAEAPGCPGEVDPEWRIEWAGTERSTFVVGQCPEQSGSTSGNGLSIDCRDSIHIS